MSAANALAAAEHLPVFRHKHNEYMLQLCYLETRIELFSTQMNTGIYVDFCAGKLAHRHKFGGGRGQAIARAIGLRQGKSPHVLDATAGLAGDAFALATLGCRITMTERSPLLATLIHDAIARAQTEPSLLKIFEHGFDLYQQNAIDYLHQLAPPARPDVIYLDPMYPERKKSARVKKSMQILQQLHGSEDNAEQLLDISLDLARKRVVVKRPIHAPSINEITPSTCIKSKKTRFDIYAIEKL